MKLFNKKHEAAEVVDANFEEVKDETGEAKEEKTDPGKIVKIVGGILVGVGAVAGVAYKVLKGKKGDDGYSEVPGNSEASEEDLSSSEASEESEEV